MTWADLGRRSEMVTFIKQKQVLGNKHSCVRHGRPQNFRRVVPGQKSFAFHVKLGLDKYSQTMINTSPLVGYIV